MVAKEKKEKKQTEKNIYNMTLNYDNNYVNKVDKNEL